MARFNTAQKCILAGVSSVLIAYYIGNFVVFTGFWCSLLLGWFFSASLLNVKSHLASEWMLDFANLLKTKYLVLLGKIHGVDYLRQWLASTEPPQPKNENVAQEIKLFIDFIIRDFVSSWYDTISNDQQTFEEIQEILEDLGILCLRKVEALNIHATAETVLRLFQKHLTEFQDVKREWKLQPNFRKKGNRDGPEFKKKKNVIQMYKKLEKFHVCLNGDVSEYRYSIVLVDTLLKVLLDEKLHKSYVAKELVTEILAVNVLRNVVHTLSDPHFLHKAIILLTSEEKPLVNGSQTKTQEAKNDRCDQPNDVVLNTSNTAGLVREEPDGGCDGENNSKDTNEHSKIASSDNQCDTNNAGSPSHRNNDTSDSLEKNDSNLRTNDAEPFLLDLAENSAYNAKHSNRPAIKVTNTSTPDLSRITNDTQNPELTVFERCLLGISPVEVNLHRTFSAPDDLVGSGCKKSDQNLVTKDNEGIEGHSEPRENPADKLLTPQPTSRRPSLPLILNDTASDADDVSMDSNDGLLTLPRFFIGSEDHSQEADDSSMDSDVNPSRDASPEIPTLRLPRPSISKEQKKDNSAGDSGDHEQDLKAETHVPPQLLFAEISIPKAESAREVYNSQTYTLYAIEYMSWHKCEDNDSWYLERHSVRRRYREFITLQDRLESHPHYRKTIRKIKGPSRWNTLHVGQMQDRRVESRRQFLQSYLQKLILKEDVGNSMAIKEFLAYEGDARIAFVKKAREIPRFDKVIVKTVSGVFKSISSALPTAPDEERPHFTSNDQIASQGPNSPGSDWTDPDRFSFSFDCQAGATFKNSEIEDVMTSLVHREDREEACSSSSSSVVDKCEDFRDALEISFLLPRSEGDGSEDITPPVVEATDSSIPLSSAVLDLAALSADGVESWIRKENIFYLIKVFFGKALERFLNDEILDLTTEKRWTWYLENLRETLWPGGEWDSEPVLPPSEEEKIITKHQAHQCLINFFPKFIPALVGFEDYDQCIGEIMECLQYPELNRQFVYCFLDHMLDMAFPEFESGQLHEELLSEKHIGEDMFS